MKTEKVPVYSKAHNMIPRLYTPEWHTDIANRKLIIENAEKGGVPHYEKDVNLFLDKREQLYYNVEDRSRVDSRYSRMPSRHTLLNPERSHPTYRYKSSLMNLTS